MRHGVMRGIASIAGLLFTQAAAADGLDGLAAPGPCAEAELRAEPDDGFDVAGGPREHFDPRDVGGAGDGGDGFVAPKSPVLTRSSCDGPTAGCADVVVLQGEGVIAEPGPSPGEGPPFGEGPR